MDYHCILIFDELNLNRVHECHLSPGIIIRHSIKADMTKLNYKCIIIRIVGRYIRRVFHTL